MLVRLALRPLSFLLMLAAGWAPAIAMAAQADCPSPTAWAAHSSPGDVFDTPAGKISVARASFDRSPDRSTLFTLPMGDLRASEMTAGPRSVHAVARIKANRPPTPIAWMTRTNGRMPRVDAAWIAVQQGNEVDAINLQALEYLYQLTLREPPVGSFTVRLPQYGGAGATKPGTQAQALARIAAARDCVAKALLRDGMRARVISWESVRLEPLQAKGNPLRVALRARSAGGAPIEGAQVSFSRGKHFACSAATDAKGVASCTMWDAHGHADAHDEDVHADTIASFGGLAAQALIQLPTTLVWSTRRWK
jgi:hypothetical protein